MKLKEIHIILALMAVQLMVCLPVITSFPIALDEPFSIFHSQKDLVDLFAIFETENNPPLHFLLLHFWIKLFGISPLAVRLLSLVFSLLTIPVLVKLTHKLSNLSTATLVTLLFVFSNFHHYHALEARTYSLFVLLFTLVLYDLFRFIFEDKRVFIGLGIWNAALLYTHYLGGFILAVEIVVLLFFYKKMTFGKVKQIGWGSLLTIVLYIPGIRLLLIRMESFTGEGTWVPEAQYSELYGNILRFFNGKYAFVGVVLVILVIVALNFKYLQAHFKPNHLFKAEYCFVFLMFGLTYFGMFVVSKVVEPIFLDRYLLYTTVPLYISVGILVFLFVKKEVSWSSFGVLIPVLLFFQLVPTNNRQPNLVADWVKSHQDPTTAILICPAFYELAFMYHYDNEIFKEYKSWDKLKAIKTNPIQGIYSANAINFATTTTAVIYIDSDARFLYPNNGIVPKIESKFNVVESASFAGGVTVYLFK